MSLATERQRTQGERWAAYNPAGGDAEVNSEGVRRIVPARWFWVGKVARASGTYDWCLTVRLPWKRRAYCYSTDDIERGYSRIILRFRGAMAMDYRPRSA